MRWNTVVSRDFTLDPPHLTAPESYYAQKTAMRPPVSCKFFANAPSFVDWAAPQKCLPVCRKQLRKWGVTPRWRDPPHFQFDGWIQWVDATLPRNILAGF